MTYINATIYADPTVFNQDNDLFDVSVIVDARRTNGMQFYMSFHLFEPLTTILFVDKTFAFLTAWGGTLGTGIETPEIVPLAIANANLATLQFFYDDNFVRGETRVTIMYRATVFYCQNNSALEGLTTAINVTSNIPASASYPPAGSTSFNALIDEIAVGIWSFFLLVLIVAFLILLLCLRTVFAMARLYRFRRYKRRMAAAGTPIVLVTPV